MLNTWLIIVGFVLVGVSTTNGGQVWSATKVSAIPTIKGRLLTVQEGCGYSKVSNNRIIGGAPAKNGAYPWMALLGFNRSIEVSSSEKTVISFELPFECGGSLITSKHVLSAAHCIDDNLIKVRLGEYDLSTTSDGDHQDISIDHVVKHEHFNGFHVINDIAIIHLVNDVDFTDRIRPICLPIDGDIVHRNFVGSNPFVAGYGRTTCDNDDNYGEDTSILMQLQVPVIELKKCEKEYRLAIADPKREHTKADGEIVFDEHILCAGYIEGGKGAYYGDSGGPLMIPVYENGSFPFYQIGIVSGSKGCVEPGNLGIYQSVQYYADWIHKQLKTKNSTE